MSSFAGFNSKPSPLVNFTAGDDMRERHKKESISW